jgi:hypothetical protein
MLKVPICGERDKDAADAWKSQELRARAQSIKTKPPLGQLPHPPGKQMVDFLDTAPAGRWRAEVVLKK